MTVVLLGLNIIIPGYLVWVALLAAILATIITHFIGRSLAETNQKAEMVEADLRQDLVVLGEDAENIAVEHAENYYQETLNSEVQALSRISRQKLKTKTKLIAFQSFYGQFAPMIPSLAAAPLFFGGFIQLAQFLEIATAFAVVSSSLSVFVDSYADLSKYRAIVARIAELQHALDNDKIAAEHRAIVRTEKNKESLKIKGLSIKHPDQSSMKLIMDNMNLKIESGDRVLIKGRSGIGKSTIFKAISGTWKYGNGKITIPAGKSMAFLAQEPTLRKGSLRAILAYPEPAKRYTPRQCAEVLQKIGGMEEFIPSLNDPKARAWSKELSGGQQQKIALARVLLKKPDWIFLDEATSKLDEESEDRAYRALDELKDTTVVSIAHRSTVEKYHSRIAFFNVDKTTKVVTIDEDFRSLHRTM